MRVTDTQRLRDRDVAFRKDVEAAPPLSTLWYLRISETEARAKTATVKPGAVILAQDRHGSCYYMYCDVLERTKHRVRVRWQREGAEQWIPYLWTHKGNRASPLRNETTERRFLSAIKHGKITK